MNEYTNSYTAKCHEEKVKTRKNEIKNSLTDFRRLPDRRIVY